MSEGLVLAGRYQLRQKLGAGGMGSVWRAHDRTLDATIAIKLIDPEYVSSAEAVARFRREAQAAAAIRSTHVVQILDYGIDNNVPFIAMELLNGESLAQRLDRVGTLTPEATAHVLAHVARALRLAHDNGIVHRDMKPDNIFLVREGDEDVGKVLDFGIARHRSGLAESEGIKTRTGMILGSPYYMSPEQATGQAVDHLTDIWSFGVIACECLTGRRPFQGDSLGALFHSICMAPLVKPSQLRSVPVGFDAWYARAAARERSGRFANIKEAADALRAICSPSGVGIPAVSEAIPGGADKVPSASAPASVAKHWQTTSAPAELSLARLPRRARTKAGVFAAIVALLTACGLFAAWRLQQSGSRASASVAPLSAPAESLPLALPATGQPPAPVVAQTPAVPSNAEPTTLAVQASPTSAPLPRQTVNEAHGRDPRRPLAAETHPTPRTTAAAAPTTSGPVAPQPAERAEPKNPSPGVNDRLGI